MIPDAPVRQQHLPAPRGEQHVVLAPASHEERGEHGQVQADDEVEVSHPLHEGSGTAVVRDVVVVPAKKTTNPYTSRGQDYIPRLVL